MLWEFLRHGKRKLVAEPDTDFKDTYFTRLRVKGVV